MRDPTKDPRPGDVLTAKIHSSVHGREVEHHIAVTERHPRSVEVLIGPFVDGSGQTGGSPHKVKLTTWRALAAKGKFNVKAEECLSGWSAILTSWERRLQ